MKTTIRRDHRLLILTGMTAAVFAVSFLCLLNRVYIVYQYFFLIPIITACFFFKKKGIIYSAVVSAAYIYLYSFFTRQDFSDEIAKLAVFVSIAVFVENLFERLDSERADILKLNSRLRHQLKMMQKAEGLSEMGSWRMDLKTDRMSWSEGLYRIFGMKPDGMEPSLDSWLAVVHPEDREMVDTAIHDSLINRQNTKIESRVVRPDGSMRWVVSSTYIEYDESGKPETYIGSFLDITDRRLYEQELYKERERFRITLSSIGDGVISTDVGGKVTLLNKQAEKLTGWDHKDAVGRPFDEVFNIVSEETRQKSESPIQRVIHSGIILGLANHTALISRYGAEYSIADSAAPIKDSQGRILGVVIVFRNVTEEKKRQNQIQYIGYHDALTGLYNRRYFEEQLQKIDTEENLPISVIMGDLNGLKVTNDAFGHAEGDRLLQKAAEAIQAACRSDDIVARWGGDEFVVLLPRTNETAAAEIVRRIEKIESGMKVGPIRVSVSFGCGTKDSKGGSVLIALKDAEDRMYEKKVVESETVRGNLIKTTIATLCDSNPLDVEHYRRVGDLAQKIGEAMNLPRADIVRLKKAGRLHDIGNIAIDSALLTKKGTLTQAEMDEIKRHPDIGYKILKSSRDTADIAEYVLYHHERYDGKGFPSGLQGEKIPLLSRIVAVADAFDVMTHDRSYRKAITVREAARELAANKGTQFDPMVVDAALKVVDGSAGPAEQTKGNA